MSSTIFLAKCQGGEHEDKYDYVLKAFSTREACQAYCDMQWWEQLAHTMTYEYVMWLDDQYRTIEPCPPYDVVCEPINKWPAGLSNAQITDEMRDERKAAQERNDRRRAAYAQSVNLWRDRRNDFIAQRLSEHITDQEYIALAIQYRWRVRDSDFEVEECQLD